MGNSKHSTVSNTSFHDHRQQINHQNFQRQLKRRKSDPEDYADVQLGRLRSVDFRLGKVVGEGKLDALLLSKLWNPHTFLFNRNCTRPHGGFGFSCEVGFSCGIDGIDEDSRYVVKQMAKPRRRYQGLEDSPLDIFDLEPAAHIQRQVLGIVLKKRDVDDKMALEGVDTFSIQGMVGQVRIKGDWTSAYEILNSDGEEILLAQRFNRISGGIEFQMYSESTEGSICMATLVRLEESKFILKVYAPVPPPIKALMISFTILLIYLLSR